MQLKVVAICLCVLLFLLTMNTEKFLSSSFTVLKSRSGVYNFIIPLSVIFENISSLSLLCNVLELEGGRFTWN